jgi:hypothetical protein
MWLMPLKIAPSTIANFSEERGDCALVSAMDIISFEA